MLDEPNLEDAVCCVHNDMYWLCVNGVAYILDGLQQLRTDACEPYSTRQYAGFYRTNLPARTIWTDDNSIYFGTENGEVCAFYTDKYNEESYYDNGVEVKAYFITPDFSGNAFYRNKTFRYLAVRLENLATSSCKIEALKNGVWVTIKDGDWAATKLIFSQTDFGEFSFVPYKAQRILASKMRLKKLDSTKFRISNVKAEPFEVYDIGLEFTENNNIK
jgi:predicted ester cyclase